MPTKKVIRAADVRRLADDLGITTGAHDAVLADLLEVAARRVMVLTGRDATLTADPTGARVVTMIAARLWGRRSSILGVAQGFADMPVYVRGADPDIDALLVQLRGPGSWGLS